MGNNMLTENQISKKLKKNAKVTLSPLSLLALAACGGGGGDGGAAKAVAQVEQTIRVDVKRLDHLMNLIGYGPCPFAVLPPGVSFDGSSATPTSAASHG